MIASSSHILPLTTIRRERLLPIPGRVIVRAGQRVNPLDVIAEANLASDHVLLDVARTFGVEADEAERMLERRVGDEVAEGDILAGREGLFQKVLRAPHDGKVVAIGEGQVLIELVTHPFELKAGMSGTVISLIPDYGAVIEANGALVQGVWGNNRADAGMLVNLMKAPDHELTLAQIDIALRGSVVLGGFCAQPDALKLASELPLRGLILSSIPAALVPLAMQLNMPILVLEGFGRIPLCTPAYKLLTTNEKRELAINAQPWNRFTGVRPEIIIPLPVTQQVKAPKEGELFAAGQQVRVCSAPYLGLTGTILNIPAGVSSMPSGVRTIAARVLLENGKQDMLPLSNLELIA